jgi:hypothetical protein
MSRKEVADYERELRLKNKTESLTNSDEILVDNLVDENKLDQDEQMKGSNFKKDVHLYQF